MHDSIPIIIQLDRRIKHVVRSLSEEALSRDELKKVSQLHVALNEVRLDIRDYYYAETHDEQQKWAKIGRHNLEAINSILLLLSSIFSPVDVAEFGAIIDQLKTNLQ